MAGSSAVAERPESVDAAAALLRDLGRDQVPVRVRGGGTKLAWGPPGIEGSRPALELSTGGLGRILEHNEGDFTAVLEAGARLADAQATFAQAGQMLALDPPLGEGAAATIGGVVATADAGPMRHRYGGPRDLVLGVTVVLSDGTVARAGGRVIKNVAGYDLGKLFTGSHGTLGLIARVAVRLHPRAEETATALGRHDDPQRIAQAAGRLAALPLEAESLDVAWERGQGTVLVRFAGATAGDQAEAACARLRSLALHGTGTVREDEELWERQRAGQRQPDGAVVKVAGVITDLEAVLRAAETHGGRVVTRVALGLSWVAIGGGADLGQRVERLRQALPGLTLTVLDGSPAVSEPWPRPPAGALAVMERLKGRFDPAGIFRPGVLVG